MNEFEKIYYEYYADIYKFCLALCHDKHIAEDITQECFIKAMKNINSYKGKCKFRVWLCQIAKNTYFTYYSRNKTVIDRGIQKKEVSLESKLAEKETAFEIHQIIHNLEEPYKEIFSLRLFGELSFLQIAELFGKTENWARVNFYRAKKKVKERMR